jgi:hypothetical protein
MLQTWVWIIPSYVRRVSTPCGEGPRVFLTGGFLLNLTYETCQPRDWPWFERWVKTYPLRNAAKSALPHHSSRNTSKGFCPKMR